MTDEDVPELPRGIALAWGVAATPQRGPKREMSVERIVDTAVELADAEGLSAVSMAAVAAKLGFTPMSLYRYVSAKDDLLLLMQEAATGAPIEEVDEADGWRERMERFYAATVRIYLRHTWLLSLPISGSPITPNSSAWLDSALAMLDGTPLAEGERLAVALGVLGQARWCGAVQAGYADRARASGLSPEEATAQEAALFDLLVTADEYPSLRAAIDEGVFSSQDDPFRFGLDRFFDGVQRYIDALGEGAERAPSSPWVELDPVETAGDRKHREAQKAVREAEKLLRAARKVERQARREAADRLAKARSGA
ncbi:AcrR family transcriptional regulator [Microbacterium resistens]|uniref:AcrR family transcriptional regulator n=1 Tax=Microbacterium resistens TaxID=156977 RepID=A0ABU1SC80_9MICO|nr:TetR/AcrR family transcriptional regulator C-terminal domain-containing protein [Microbacterium resistens]MDR6867215.1 AcrR family transcriptional regulator [Microbacterium resistens]